MKDLTEKREKNQQRARQIHDGRSSDPSRDREQSDQLYLRLAETHPGARARTHTRLGTPDCAEELTFIKRDFLIKFKLFLIGGHDER